MNPLYKHPPPTHTHTHKKKVLRNLKLDGKISSDDAAFIRTPYTLRVDTTYIQDEMQLCSGEEVR